MADLRDKSINNGGRIDAISKIMGGMSFSGNAQPTTVGAQNAWVVVGAGAVGHSTYTSVVPVTDNPQFTITGAVTNLQKLVYSAGKTGSYVNINFGITALIPGGGTISTVEYRLRKTDASSTTSTVATGSVGAAVLAFRFPAETSTIATISPGDQFFIEIENITANQNVTVYEAHIIISQ